MNRVIGYAMLALLFGGYLAFMTDGDWLLAACVSLATGLIVGWVLMAIYLICKE